MVVETGERCDHLDQERVVLGVQAVRVELEVQEVQEEPGAQEVLAVLAVREVQGVPVVPPEQRDLPHHH